MFLLLLKFSGGSGLQPHRRERHIRSTDPAFETKVADVIGLYLDPRQHAVVFGVDEKTAIQALDEGASRDMRTGRFNAALGSVPGGGPSSRRGRPSPAARSLRPRRTSRGGGSAGFQKRHRRLESRDVERDFVPPRRALIDLALERFDILLGEYDPRWRRDTARQACEIERSHVNDRPQV